MLVTALLIFAENVTDPLLGFWFPLYYPAKIAFVAWMVYPGTQGANFLFVKHLEPAIRELTEEFGAVA